MFLKRRIQYLLNLRFAFSLSIMMIVFILFSLRAEAADSKFPNIVIILADDQCYRDFGFIGNSQVHTPNIDQIAGESARFLNGYVPMSVCRPSLATLLTGLYPHQHGIHFNHPPPGLGKMRRMTAREYHKTRSQTNYLIEKVATLPRILASHGYVCLQTGKHWEGDYSLAGFTHGMTRGLPAERLGSVTGTREQRNGEWVAHGNGDAGLVIGRETMKPIEKFIEEYANRKPFFVWYAPFLPHIPFDAPQKYHDVYSGKKIPEYLKPYYAEIARFDETVGQLIEMLEQNQVLDETLIVFVSDNGFRPDKTNPHRQDKQSKLSEYEDGLRTPILIRWAGHVKPADHPEPVSTVDLVPTLLSVVGLSSEISNRMKGRNLMPAAVGKEVLENQSVFGAIYPNDAKVLGDPGQQVRGRWVRSGDYKLLLPGPADNPVSRSLFDVKKDPEEKNNLIDDPEQAERIDEMTNQLNQWWKTEDKSQVTQP